MLNIIRMYSKNKFKKYVGNLSIKIIVLCSSPLRIIINFINLCRIVISD